jgi:hypothetical protein
LKAPRRPRSLWPALLAGAGLLLLVAAVVGVLLTRPSHGKEAAKSAPPAKGKPVQLAGVTAFDPEGSGGEHDADAPKASDGDPATFWTTEMYRSFTKSGVGLVLDAKRAVRLSQLTVSTDTPGFTAVIKAGSSPQGPFAAVSGSETVGGTTAFRLHSAAARYYLVWITKLAGRAHVNEVKAS